MLHLPCPCCGLRDESEFSYRGEVTVRPDPDLASDSEWIAYLYYRSNVRGWLREYWAHTHGCQQLFIILRHTVTHEIAADP
jgi:heterotetrameric sarcosine oxidase delta subunit